MFCWSESLESLTLAMNWHVGAPAMTSDDSACCLGDATTEYDYNCENDWIEKSSIIMMQLRKYADSKIHGKCK